MSSTERQNPSAPEPNMILSNEEEVVEVAKKIIEELTEQNPNIPVEEIIDIVRIDIKRMLMGAILIKNEIQARINGDHNQAFPSIEMVMALDEQGINAFDFEWRAVPHLPKKTHGPIDALKSIEAILEDTRSRTILKRALRTMDIGKGCGIQCDTCLADAQPLETLFTLDSLGVLFDDPRFQSLIHLGGLRIGSSGDITDHPNPAQITELALKGTEVVNNELREKTGLPHRIKIYTNFRKQRTKKIDALLEIAMREPERIALVISLPMNRHSKTPDEFRQYAAERPEIFGRKKERKNVSIHSVPERGDTPSLCGRVLSENLAIGKKEIEARHSPMLIAQRGYAKPYLNPDGLWCFGYVGPYESHTNRAFTPLTPGNIPFLQHIPWTPYFIHDPECANPPPNWAGGTNKGYYQYQIFLDQLIMSGTGLDMRRTTIV